MSDQIRLEKEMPPEKATEMAAETKEGQAACPMPGKGWLKGPLGMFLMMRMMMKDKK